MKGFIVLACVAACLAGEKARAAGCGDLKSAPTRINIELELPEPFYDLGQGMRDINKNREQVSGAWIERNGLQKLWKSSDMFLLGYAEGAMGMSATLKMDVKNYDRYGVYYCPYVTDVNLSMIFRTRIVIPKEFGQGGCRFGMVQEHELRHYAANREVTEEFVRRLYKDLPVIIAEVEKRQPYVEGKNVVRTLKDMQAGMKDVIQSYIVESMRAEAQRRNGIIDSPEEYASSAPKMKMCRD